MPFKMLDYAKWNSLEICDDSDSECSPGIGKEKPTTPKKRMTAEEYECTQADIGALKWAGKLNATVYKQLQQLLTNTETKGVIHLREAAAKLASAQAQAQGQESFRKDLARTALINSISEILTKVKHMRPAEQHAAAIQELKSHATEHEKREKIRKAELEKRITQVHNYTTSAQTDEDSDPLQSPKHPAAASNSPTSGPSQSTSTEKDKEVTEKDKAAKNDKSTEKSKSVEKDNSSEKGKSVEKGKSAEKDKSVKQDKSTKKGPQAKSTHSAPGGSGARSEQAKQNKGNQVDPMAMAELTPSARAFSKIKPSDPTASYMAIRQDASLYTNHLATEAIMMEAFEAERIGNKEYAKNCVHQSLMLKYCRTLYDQNPNCTILRKVLSGEAAPQVPMEDVDWLYEDVVGKIKFLKEFQRWTGAA